MGLVCERSFINGITSKAETSVIDGVLGWIFMIRIGTEEFIIENFMVFECEDESIW